MWFYDYSEATRWWSFQPHVACRLLLSDQPFKADKRQRIYNKARGRNSEWLHKLELGSGVRCRTDEHQGCSIDFSHIAHENGDENHQEDRSGSMWGSSSVFCSVTGAKRLSLAQADITASFGDVIKQLVGIPYRNQINNWSHLSRKTNLFISASVATNVVHIDVSFFSILPLLNYNLNRQN